jgi:hypothetical protein
LMQQNCNWHKMRLQEPKIGTCEIRTPLGQATSDSISEVSSFQGVYIGVGNRGEGGKGNHFWNSNSVHISHRMSMFHMVEFIGFTVVAFLCVCACFLML